MTTEAAPSVRASDADRERVAAIVSAAAGKGMLTLAEADERLAQVYTARYVSDLAPITADLPDGGRPLAPVDQRVRSAARSDFARHLAGYLGLAAVLITIWAATGAGYFWPVWPLVGVGIGVLKHGRWARYAGQPGQVSSAPSCTPMVTERSYGYRHGGYRHGCGRGGWR